MRQIRWKCLLLLKSDLGFAFGRNMLHNLPVHVRGWHQFRTVPLPSLHVRDTGGHQPRVWLVHVLRLGWTGPHVAGWLPVHPRPVPVPPAHPRGAQTQAGEWLRVTQTPLTSPVDRDNFTQGLRRPESLWTNLAQRKHCTAAFVREKLDTETFEWRQL